MKSVASQQESIKNITPKKITILGSTGSIGRQTLEVIRQFPGEYRVEALAARSNLDLLLDQVREFKPRRAIIGNPDLYHDLKLSLRGTDTIPGAGPAGLIEAATLPETQIVLTALVGAVGIQPTLAAITAGKTIALANKETLVAAGSLIIPLAQKQGAPIIPVDSEHSAIFQCLAGQHRSHVAHLILTASGGPFRNLSPEQLKRVSVAEALRHPNWQMGGKITIDSATMFNKGLEIIEAHWLFDMPYDRIKVVIHPESIVHSLIELADGSHLAQLGLCDMRLPIQLALTYPERRANGFPKLDLTQGAVLHFQPVDPGLFPAVSLAYQAGRCGGSLPAAFNAANEVAVAAFLEGKIKFTGITGIVSEVMGYHQNEGFGANPDLEEIMRVDDWARGRARVLISRGGSNHVFL